MGGNYETDIYNQLMEVMERLECAEKKCKEEITVLINRISTLEKENEHLKKENKLLRDDNERLKSIIHHDSTNTSLPPSTDQKGKKANQYSSRGKSNKKQGGQYGHKGTTLTKKDVEGKLKTGQYTHQIQNIGKPQGDYVTKYIMDIEVIPIIREIRIYRDERGKFHIPAGLHSDVTYGSNINTIAVDLYGEGSMSNDRICDFINTISGNKIELSTGSVYGFCKKLCRKSSSQCGTDRS